MAVPFKLLIRTSSGRSAVSIPCAHEDSEAAQAEGALTILRQLEEDAEDGYPLAPTLVHFPERGDTGGVRLSVLARHFTGARLKFATSAASSSAISSSKKKKKKKETELGGGDDRHYVECDTRTLFLTLGLWRALANDVAEYNDSVSADRARAMEGEAPEGAEKSTAAAAAATARRYGRHRLMKQLREFGAKRPAEGRLLIVEGLTALIAVIEALNAEELADAREAIAGGTCGFDGFAELYAPGREVLDRRGAITGLFGVATAFVVRSCFFREGKSMMKKTERTCHVALEFIVSTGRRFAVVEVVQVFVPFKGRRRFAELDLAPLREEDVATRARLEKRGEVYQRVAVGQHFVGYTASTFLPMRAPLGGGAGGNRKTVSPFAQGSGRGTKSTARPGRMMVDTSASHVVGHNAARFTGIACDAVLGAMRYELAAERTRDAAKGGSAGVAAQAAALSGDDDDDGPLMLEAEAVMPARLLRRCWPAVAGFSFTSKSWGVLIVDGLVRIAFRDDAFDRIVLPEGRKELLRAIVEDGRSRHPALDEAGAGGEDASGESESELALHRERADREALSDIVDGKGEGTLFLLFGPPGVGKTLTAEAMAESMHLPLYTVSMGEVSRCVSGERESIERERERERESTPTLNDPLTTFGCIILIFFVFQLGTSADVLEDRLGKILALCAQWGALVLVDEAEMLLERRSTGDVVRNAMVNGNKSDGSTLHVTEQIMIDQLLPLATFSNFLSFLPLPPSLPSPSSSSPRAGLRYAAPSRILPRRALPHVQPRLRAGPRLPIARHVRAALQAARCYRAREGVAQPPRHQREHGEHGCNRNRKRKLA